MPLYEYQCGSCGHRFERIQKFSDAALTDCPQCGGRLEKLISSPAIQFKGSGWYINDYAKAGQSDGKSTSSKSEGSSADGKADKPAADAKADKPSTSEPAPKPAASSTDKA
jgi:putative FmdB family regulatory protein